MLGSSTHTKNPSHYGREKKSLDSCTHIRKVLVSSTHTQNPSRCDGSVSKYQLSKYQRVPNYPKLNPNNNSIQEMYIYIWFRREHNLLGHRSLVKKNLKTRVFFGRPKLGLEDSLSPFAIYVQNPLDMRIDNINDINHQTLYLSFFLHKCTFGLIFSPRVICGIYGDVFYTTHMPYVENFRFLHICHVETSEIS